MPLHHPFQKLCLIPANNEHKQILLGASGCTINSISFHDGRVLHQWPLQQEHNAEEIENDDRPNKRRKLDSNGHEQNSSQQSEVSDVSVEIVAERKKGERKKSKFIDTKLSTVSHLLATSDGQHVIGVTAEDKAIRVFKINSQGRLSQLSQRSLPKKLCALRLSKDEKTILVADKFGDVYTLPLHQAEDWKPKEKPQVAATYKPAATELTVHTKGNREALKQQLERKQQNARKEGPKFEHKLLLGHVSLLTDLIVAESVVDGVPRPFILTSDRDEHIRVSRGIPQAHIIETYCLGHTEFISRMCIPPSHPQLLIAGNGEVSLRVYDWIHGKLLQNLALDQLISVAYAGDKDAKIDNGNALPESRGWTKLAVSGIWPVNITTTENSDSSASESLILVSIEGLPLLMGFVIGPDGLRVTKTINFRGNVLDVVVLESRKQLLVSIDNVHQPACMKTYRDNASDVPSLQLIKLDGSFSSEQSDFSYEMLDLPAGFAEIGNFLPEAPPSPPEEDESKIKAYPKIFSPLGEFLYGFENLRKKRGIAADDGTELDAEEVEDLKLEEPPES